VFKRSEPEHTRERKEKTSALHNLIAGGAERDLLGVRAISQDYLARAFLRLSLAACRRKDTREGKDGRPSFDLKAAAQASTLNPFARLSKKERKRGVRKALRAESG
jgi:hypothetical protein